MRINSPKLNIMYKACMKAAKFLIRDFGEVEKLQVSKKGPNDFVTKTDKLVEKIIIEASEQSNQINIPSIAPLQNLDSFLKKNSMNLIFTDLNSSNNKFDKSIILHNT